MPKARGISIAAASWPGARRQIDLGPQPPRVDPPVAPATVLIQALRDHYGTRGMVLAGGTDDRSADDAAYLVAQGIATIVGPAQK